MLANYTDEKDCFGKLFDAASSDQIMLVIGESGTGKTSLVNELIRIVPPGYIDIPIQLRGRTVDVAEIFNRVVEIVGKSHFSNFSNEMATFGQAPTISVERNLVWNHSDISIALDNRNNDEREYRLSMLTDALFRDIAESGVKVLFVFDTFEEAGEDTQNWISGPFLARVARSINLCAVVAGQIAPSENNIEWGRCCGGTRRLDGVFDAAHWMPIVDEMKRSIPQVPELVYLAGICHAHRGNPSKIKKEIDLFPLREDLS